MTGGAALDAGPEAQSIGGIGFNCSGRMRWVCRVALAASAMSAAAPAYACRDTLELNSADAKLADMVVVGQIANYETTKFCFDTPSSHPRMCKEGARFDILVDEALKGDAPKRLTVTWLNSLFSMPKSMGPGSYLIALLDHKTSLQGRGFDRNPTPEMTVMQEGCRTAFLIESASDKVAEIRAVLGTTAN